MRPTKLTTLWPTVCAIPQLSTRRQNSSTDARVTSGPVAENIKDQGAKTSAEFSNLAAARQTPSTPAATGQPLTHYHSFFSELLSWNNPRTCPYRRVTCS